jgi:hypothetical protein
MTASPPLYARPEIVRGEQCAEAPLGRQRSDPVAACRCSRQCRARWQVASLPSVMVVECRVCRPQQHGSASQRRRWCQDVRYPLCLARPVRVIRQRPCVQRPPGRRPACVRCPHVWCPMPGVRVRGPELSVRHRMSGVRCPVPASGIRACRVRVCSIRTGKFVEREGAAGSHTPRDRPGRRITLPICRAAGARRFAHCGRLREVGRSVLPAARHDLSPWVVGRPRWEVLGRQRERAPPRPKAAGGPQQQSGREGKPGLVSENCGGPAET